VRCADVKAVRKNRQTKVLSANASSIEDSGIISIPTTSEAVW
jgi:hypothetical protein